jgi:phosphoribosyl 1,2-cyclic phosphodiesterase
MSEQHDALFYLKRLRDGEPYDWVIINGVRKKRYFTESQQHCDRLSELITGLKPSTADETEAEIRAKLLIWSPSP